MQASCLKRYESFLESVNLSAYSQLRNVKTVEQDLPRSLNPLPLIYEYYWEKKLFLDYDDFFSIYWDSNLSSIMEFVKRYFYGCSLQFVEEGFKARIYRTWTSLLTQFHFQYLWRDSFCTLYPLKASAELDMKGIDSLVFIDGRRVGIQVKKISFRREASQRRFTKRQKTVVDVICEVPYLVLDIEELKRKLESPRTRRHTKERAKFLLCSFYKYFRKLKNGFVVFKREYVEFVKDKVVAAVKGDKEFIPYTEFLGEV